MAFGDFTVDRNSTKYVLGSGGTIVSYPTDEPAFEFNADGTYKGLLVEPAATNLLTYSEDFTVWATTTSPIITANSGSSPDGTNTADKFDADTSAQIFKTFTVTAGATYTFSVWIKGVSSSGTTEIHFSNPTDPPANTTSVSFTTDWQRFVVTGSIPTTNAYTQIGTWGSNNSGPSADILIWGAQLETGPIATSYIPTASAAVTRVKDDITQTGAQSLIGQTEGTLYVEVDWRAASGTYQILLDVTDGTSDDRVLIYKTNGDVLSVFANAGGGSAEAEQGESASAYSGIQKIAFAYKTDDFELYRNGSSIATDTSGSLASLATLTDIDLGQNVAANDQANMWIRAVAIYPKRLSDAECEALTTL